MAKDTLTAVGALGLLIGMVLLVFVRASWQYALMIVLVGVVAIVGVAVVDALERVITHVVPGKSEPVAPPYRCG